MTDPTDHERKLAEKAAERARAPKARLLHVRPSGAVLLVSMSMPDGTLVLLRVQSMDTPGLEFLADEDRSRIAGGLSTMHQRLHDGADHAA